ncbi:hypothetical protein SASPL_144584 [Salvia splendens]|uniref:Uncharacterized protein n=1 Tax=Salvia splendens TaxID=180675 RepID=A0A8X8WGT3_SALSN|nr:hypothetical protein SASPL_144584 [Salvia splendens]
MAAAGRELRGGAECRVPGVADHAYVRGLRRRMHLQDTVGEAALRGRQTGGGIVDTLWVPLVDVDRSSDVAEPSTGTTPFNMFSPILPKEESATAMAKAKEDLLESGSGSEHIEGASGNEQEAEQQPPPKSNATTATPPARSKRWNRAPLSLSRNAINKINSGGDEGAGVANGGEAIDGAEVAGDINGDEEKVGLPWLERANITAQQDSVDGHLRRE